MGSLNGGTLDPNSSGSSGAPNSGTYEHQSHSLATIEGDGYFDAEFDKLRRIGVLRVFAADGRADYDVDVDPIDRHVTLSRIAENDFRRLGAKPGTSPNASQLEKNNQALEAAAASGTVYRVPAGQTFAFSRGVTFVSGSGLVCDGWAIFLMKTGSGQFDTTNNSPAGGGVYRPYTSNRVSLFQNVAEAEKVVIKGIEVKLEANAAIRVGAVAHFYRLHNSVIDVRSRDFKESYGGFVRLRSCQSCSVKHEAMNLNCNTASLAVMQCSVMDLDDAMTGDPYEYVVTSGCHLHAIGHDFALGATAKAQYAPQTDIFACASRDRQAGGGAIIHAGNTVIAESRGVGAGEILDTNGAGSFYTLLWDDCQIYPVKLIYGASDNVIKAHGSGTGLAAVFIASNSSHPTRANPCNDNTVSIDCVDVGRNWYAGIGAMQAGIYLQGDASPLLANKPKGNIITGRVESYAGGIMDIAVQVGLTGDNMIKVKSDTWDVAFASIYVDAQSKYPDIERVGRTKSIIEAHYATAGPTAIASGARIPFTTEDVDTRGDYTPATPQAVLNAQAYFDITGCVYIPALGAGRTASVVLTHAGVQTVIGQRNNATGAGLAVYLAFAHRVRNTTIGAGADIIVVTDDASAVGIAGSAAAPFPTHLRIIEGPQYFPATIL